MLGNLKINWFRLPDIRWDLFSNNTHAIKFNYPTIEHIAQRKLINNMSHARHIDKII